MSGFYDRLRIQLSRIRYGCVSAYYDGKLGVNTRGTHSQRDLGTDETVSYPYVAQDWVRITRALQFLDPGADDVFLDVGSGKGRAMIAALQFPYRKAVGVEISAGLCETAGENLQRFSGRWKTGAGSWEIHQADAAVWKIPDEVTHVHLYSPFRGAAFESFLDRIRESLMRAPRTVRIVYATPILHDQVMKREWISETVPPARGLREGFRFYIAE